MAGKRNFFSSEGYQRLEKNPFVNKEMLQFIRGKWREAAHTAPQPVTTTSATGLSKSPQARKRVSGGSAKGKESAAKEKVIRLMTATIKSLLRE